MLLRHASVQGDPDIFVAMSSHRHHHPAAGRPQGHAADEAFPVTTESINNNNNDDNSNGNSLDDVWATDDDHANLPYHHHHHHHHLLQQQPSHPPPLGRRQEPSDLPRLAQAHRTAGYRDGIALAKSRFAQPGFDEGYPLGAALGARAGELLGVLEGLAAAVGLVSLHSSFPPSPPSSSAGAAAGAGAELSSSSSLFQGGADAYGSSSGNSSSGGGGDGEARRMEHLLAEARRELGPQAVFAQDYFSGEDGTWRYRVAGEEGRGDDEDEVVFADVAEAHPLLRKWREIVRGEAARYGVDLEIFGREDGGGWGRGAHPLLPHGDEEDEGEGEEDGRRQRRERKESGRPVARRGGREAFAW
ncbi:hypothetical protein VTJ83DRAFT_699 [Remersonia thermophila]|uniref:Protein YAE1 n=1 Tax=Remersonia thermophila TaxID=72144 RepID=A0ABR4DLS1_9PEZI